MRTSTFAFLSFLAAASASLDTITSVAAEGVMSRNAALDKVTEMLGEMTTNVQADRDERAQLQVAAAARCVSDDAAKQATVDTTSTEVSELSAAVATGATELNDAKDERIKNSALLGATENELNELVSNRTKEVHVYTKSLLEHEEALKAFEMAIQVLAGSGGAAAFSADASLLAKQKAFVRKAQLAHQKVRAGQDPQASYDAAFDSFNDMDINAAYAGNSVSTIEGTLATLKADLSKSKSALIGAEEKARA